MSHNGNNNNECSDKVRNRSKQNINDTFFFNIYTIILCTFFKKSLSQGQLDTYSKLFLTDVMISTRGYLRQRGGFWDNFESTVCTSQRTGTLQIIISLFVLGVIFNAAVALSL